MNQDIPFHLPDFSDLHIMVIGDIMEDRYLSGHIARISPEAPVPIFELDKVENRLGGAANVALNLIALGARVTLVTICGDDQDGSKLLAMLDEIPGLNPLVTIIPDRITTVKTRIMAANQHILRIDNEDISDIGVQYSDLIFRRVRDFCMNHSIDGIILQDYNKGLMTIPLIHTIIDTANSLQIPTFVDPKEKNFFEYRNCTLFKPNNKEAMRATGQHLINPEKADQLIRQKLTNKMTVITLGKDGMYIHDGKSGMTYPTSPRDISDVCGAGDTVISVLCCCYLKGLDAASMARIANTAGGQVCEHPGVVSVNRSMLEAELAGNQSS